MFFGSLLMLAGGSLLMWIGILETHWPTHQDLIDMSWIIGVVYPIVVPLSFLLVIAMFSAWRWVLTTGAIFGALITVNHFYVLWLESLAAN